MNYFLNMHGVLTHVEVPFITAGLAGVAYRVATRQNTTQTKASRFVQYLVDIHLPSLSP